MLGADQVLNQGRYRIIGSRDEEPSGGVYEAYDTVIGANVILKESVASIGKVAPATRIEAINAAFADQAKALAAIRHDSIVTVQDYFTEIDRQYLVCESVTGDSLTKYLHSAEARPKLTDVLAWTEQILSALHYLHTLSPPVIHGEIRPDNIKLTSDLKVKLLTAKVSGLLVETAARVKPDGTDTAFNYKPLEQIWPEIEPAVQKAIIDAYDEKAAGILLRPLDARSDIYSTGATFYHLLTGVAPVDALERSIAILEGRSDPLVPPNGLDPSIPTEISDVLMRAMSIRRENRFDWAVIMTQTLRTAVILAKERASKPKTLAEKGPTTTKEIPMDQIPMRPDPESVFDHTSHEAHLELRQQLATDRLSELEAEQARLDEERNKIEQRRLELEAEKERHAAERERLRQEAEEARQRADEERKRLEKERLEQEAAQERQKIAEKIAALEADRERERAEQERLAKEAEAERLRAEQRLQELHTEQERRRLEQERIELEAKKELERVEQRLMEISGVNLEISKPATSDAKPAAEGKLPKRVFERSTKEADEIIVPDFSGRSGRNWHTPIVGGAAVLIVAAVAGWLVLQPVDAPAPAVQVTQSAVLPPQTPLTSTEPTSVPDQVPAESSPAADHAAVPVKNDTTSVQTDTASQNEANDVKEEHPASGQRHPQISSVTEKQKKPAGEKPAAAKKKVTVDDLIHDN